MWIIPMLFVFLAASSSTSSLTSAPPHPKSIYYNWTRGEWDRKPRKKWLVTDDYAFGRSSADNDIILATKICYVPRSDTIITVDAKSLVHVFADHFTVLTWDHDSKTSEGITCSIRLVPGSYSYHITDDGESLTVTHGKDSKVWRRVGPPFDIEIPAREDEPILTASYVNESL
jgi:hypothetical protein